MKGWKIWGDCSLWKKKGKTNSLAGCVAWEMAESLQQEQPTPARYLGWLLGCWEPPSATMGCQGSYR